jgi:hypothetical protein
MTTSMGATKAEIARFLSGSEPAVLCVTGDWGSEKPQPSDVAEHLRNGTPMCCGPRTKFSISQM